MPNLKFKQLLLLSDSLKLANQFEFDDNLTLITANDNSVGKSTLVKLIFWTLGCEPVLDTIWESLDCKTLLKFEVGLYKYEVMRYKGLVWMKDSDRITSYTQITGDFSERIASLFAFSALLPKRNKDELDVPPPAYYFLPFYIDQKRSWGNAWDNFLNLGQFNDWKSTIIKYHIGLLPPKHFNLELDKFLKRKEQATLSDGIKKLEATIEIIQSYIPPTMSTIDNSKLSSMAVEIQVDLKNLSERQEKLFDELSKAEEDTAFLLNQKLISARIINELEKDYRYAVENIDGEEIECPLCGTVHENSIINRASILTDKQQAEIQLEEIAHSIQRSNEKLNRLNIELEDVKNRIAEINDKYILEEENRRVNLNDIIETIAGRSIREKAETTKGNKIIGLKGVKKEIKSISKEQKNVISEDEKELIITAFNSIFTSYIQVLGAEAVNISTIKSPLDYNKVVKEGGAAESTRAILAYYLAIYSLIKTYGSEVIAPLVIDTPNQHEQSHINYDRIVNLITNGLSKDSQIIVCAMDSERLNPIKQTAKIIFLSDNKLLHDSKYVNVERHFIPYKVTL